MKKAGSHATKGTIGKRERRGRGSGRAHSVRARKGQFAAAYRLDVASSAAACQLRPNQTTEFDRCAAAAAAARGGKCSFGHQPTSGEQLDAAHPTIFQREYASLRALGHSTCRCPPVESLRAGTFPGLTLAHAAPPSATATEATRLSTTSLSQPATHRGPFVHPYIE